MSDHQAAGDRNTVLGVDAEEVHHRLEMARLPDDHESGRGARVALLLVESRHRSIESLADLYRERWGNLGSRTVTCKVRQGVDNLVRAGLVRLLDGAVEVIDLDGLVDRSLPARRPLVFDPTVRPHQSANRAADYIERLRRRDPKPHLDDLVVLWRADTSKNGRKKTTVTSRVAGAVEELERYTVATLDTERRIVVLHEPYLAWAASVWRAYVAEDPGPRCGKVVFADQAKAADAVVQAKIARALRGRQKRREQRTYWCGPCGGWHLTSKDDRFSSPAPGSDTTGEGGQR